MAYRNVTVDVEVCIDDIISEARDQELIDELNNRGYTVTGDDERESFDREDWQLLLKLVDSVPETVYIRRVRDKLMEARYG